MVRAWWSVPSAVPAWFVVGFAPSYLAALPGGATALLPASTSQVDLLVVGGFLGSVAAALIVRRLRIALPLVLAIATATWWFGAGRAETHRPTGLFIALLVASILGAVAGALARHGSVLTAMALSLPFAWYARKPTAGLADWRWNWQLSGLSIAVGLAVLLYVSCWRKGWRAVAYWPMVAATYLICFAVLAAGGRVAGGFGQGGGAAEIADGGTQAFFAAFEPLLRTYWPWLVAAVLLAVPMTALKIRALPPPARPVDPYAERSNDARLSDDLDWIDREEPPRRLLPRGQPAA